MSSSPGRLVANYSIFNAQELIYDSLVSVTRAVDEIRVYDGRFIEYRCPCGTDHDNSCDNTAREIEQFQAEYPLAPVVKYIPFPAMPEVEKRSRMMQDGAFGDVVFVIDDDELFFGRTEPLRDFADTKPAKFAYIDSLLAGGGHGTGVSMPLARLFVRTPGLRYDGAFFRIADNSGLVVDMRSDNKNVAYGQRRHGRFYLHPSARIVGLYENYRTKAREKAKTDYNNLVAKRDWNR